MDVKSNPNPGVSLLLISTLRARRHITTSLVPVQREFRPIWQEEFLHGLEKDEKDATVNFAPEGRSSSVSHEWKKGDNTVTQGLEKVIDFCENQVLSIF